MSIKEYDLLSDGEEKCFKCHTTEDVTVDEDGNFICYDCLFERECGLWDAEDAACDYHGG